MYIKVVLDSGEHDKYFNTVSFYHSMKINAVGGLEIYQNSVISETTQAKLVASYSANTWKTVKEIPGN